MRRMKTVGFVAKQAVIAAFSCNTNMILERQNPSTRFLFYSFHDFCSHFTTVILSLRFQFQNPLF